MDKGIGMLVDTAHAVTSGVNPAAFVQMFGNKVREVHLVDGFKGKMDVHYALGTGEVKYSAFLDELIKAKYAGPVILELKSEKDVLDSVKLLKEKGYM